jgi:hypothetical protein
MEIQITIALIAALGSFIGIAINIFFSVRIASRQNKLELKKTRIDLLESRRIAVQQASLKIMEKFNDIKDIKNPASLKSMSRIMDYHNEIFMLFLAVGNFFPVDLCDEVVKVKNNIIEFRGKANAAGCWESLYGNALQAEFKISGKINSYLRNLESELQKLLK